MTSRKKALINREKKRGFFMPWGHLFGGLAPIVRSSCHNSRPRIITLGLIFLFLTFPCYAEINYPQNLWKGLIAEDTGGDYRIYLHIASCVRNRLFKRLDIGLVALRRKDLDDFVAENYLYVLKKYHVDLQELSIKAILEVFENGKDYCNGATRFEHTKIYGIPKDLIGIKPIKILYAGTKKEITFWKER